MLVGKQPEQLGDHSLIHLAILIGGVGVDGSLHTAPELGDVRLRLFADRQPVDRFGGNPPLLLGDAMDPLGNTEHALGGCLFHSRSVRRLEMKKPAWRTPVAFDHAGLLSSGRPSESGMPFS